MSDFMSDGTIDNPHQPNGIFVFPETVIALELLPLNIFMVVKM